MISGALAASPCFRLRLDRSRLVPVSAGRLDSLAWVAAENSSPADAQARRDPEQLRTARLLFDEELRAGTLDAAALATRDVRNATAVRRVPPRVVRLIQQVRYKAGGLRFAPAVTAPLQRARRAALGARAAAPPRFLIRVDEFPHYMADDDPQRFGVERFARFHEIMHSAGVPYLIAVLPRVSRQPLSPTASGSRALDAAEQEMLARLGGERVTLAMHGLDHRTRFADPRRRSELSGLSAAQLERLLDEGLQELARHEIRPQVFVPPYNRFDAAQWPVLARRFAIVGGGPESIGTLGFHSTPQWRDESVYLPSYAPLYGRAGEVLTAVEQLIDERAGLWLPVVLHWGWEADDGWSALERLASRIAPYAASWEQFAAAVARSSAGAAAERVDRPESAMAHGASPEQRR
jgi:hypothetical protein